MMCGNISLVMYLLLLPLLCSPLCTQAISLHDYHQLRHAVRSQRQQYGAELTLTENEEAAERILLRYKEEEILDGIKTESFPPSRSFFSSKRMIERSKVFQIIKSMPKGAALHLHDLAMVDPSWVVSNLTYRTDCYVCMKGVEIMAFSFSKTRPHVREDCKWSLTSEARREQESPYDFDDLIIHHLTIEPDNNFFSHQFDSCCVNQNLVWQRAEKAFKLLSELFFVQPNLGEFWKQALSEFRDDGVLYVEPRSLVAPTTDADGNTYDEEYYLKVYQQVTDQFVLDNPDFVGSKVIKCDLKFMDVNTVNKSLNLVMELRHKYPDFLAGYDLVGQEDKATPLEQYLDALLRPSQMAPPVTLPYFFHAGETDWLDTVIDWNLLDAILLNSSRIGHAYCLVKHPHLLKLVKERDIAVEVNPISNQVLGLVTDLRNHPVTYLLAQNVSVVVSSDDPSIWRSLPMSHDFYQVFMANTGMKDGLRVLKKLALNSIKYSSMNELQRTRAYHVFGHQWEEFITDVIKDYS